MVYASVIVILKNGRYHSYSWKDLGSSKEVVEASIKRKYGDKFFSYLVSFDAEEVQTWTNNLLSKNKEIDARLKVLAVENKAKSDAAHAANLAKKKPKVNKPIKVQSYGQWMSQKHIKAVKKGSKKPQVKTT